jgi:multidrug resistance protein, MATE family
LSTQSVVVEPAPVAVNLLGTVRAEARPLIALAIPMIAGSLSYTLIMLTNSFVLGPLGETPLAAASLTMSISIIVFGALFGLLGPLGYLIGTAFGADDAPKIAEVMKHGLPVGIGTGCVGAVLMSIALLALPYLSQPAEVLAIITPYWLLSAVAMIPFFVTQVYKQYFDATNRPWTGTLLSLIPVVLNIPLAWLLVNGAGPMPPLGLTGAGLAGLLSGSFGTALFAWHFYTQKQHAPYRVDRPWRFASVVEILREGLPMGVQYLLEGGAITVAGVLIGLLGATALAANQITFSVLGILWIFPIGMSAAVGIRVAQAAGGGERLRARGIGVSGMLLASLWSLLFVVLLTGFGERVAALFVDEPNVIRIAAALFVVWGAAQIFDGIQSTGVGVLRGLFDSRYPTVVSLIAYWLISLPLGYAMGFWLGWGAPGVWAGYGAGLAVASALLVRRLWRVTGPGYDTPTQQPE